MERKKTSGLPAPVARVLSRIERWRRTRRKRTPMPEELWEAAVELARAHGVNPIAEALRVNYYALKRRVKARPAVSASREVLRPAFVELGLRPPLSPAGWVLEVEDPRGTKLKIHSGGPGDLDPVALTEAFLRAGT